MIKQTNNKNRVYGIIGLVALFLVGGIFGFIINGTTRTNHSVMSMSQCQDLARKIVNAANNNQPDLILQLNKVFSENCNDRIFKKEQQQSKPVVKEKKLPETTCAAVEELLKQGLNDENSDRWDSHERNVKTYTVLAEKGCPENAEKYKKLAQREAEIAKALESKEYGTPENDTKSTCEQIESLLTEKLDCVKHSCGHADAHIRDAQIYANLSERGCAANSKKYKQLAKQELEIARALNDDNMESGREQSEAIEMVETYKRLQMQAEAAKILEKAKKLTNPAIDFIIQLEKIIEE